MSRPKMKRILFVCTGNTCRSPMAEVILKDKLLQAGVKNVKVYSAGIRATVGSPMNEKTAQTLMEKGFEEVKFSSAQLTDKLLKEAYAIVCMTDSQRDILMDMRWNTLRKAGEENIENNVYCFSELTGYEVLDPYGKDLDCYRYVYELLAGGMSALIEKLLPVQEKKRTTRKSSKK